MSLYYDAAAAIANKERVGGSLKARIYANKQSKHSPAQVYALVSETTKWSSILKEVIEKAELLKHERKLSDVIAMLLVHDQLLSKKGIAAPQNHPLALAVSRHRSRLHAEFTKLRIRRGFSSLDALRKSIEEQPQEADEQDLSSSLHPRWIRANLLKTTLQEELQTTFADYEKSDSLSDVLSANKDKKILLLDKNVENLIALPPQHNIHKSEAYKAGRLIFQDKASCIPASLLDPKSISGDIIDACSAPGNKTTHLAALLESSSSENHGRKIFAFERDKNRSEILRKMVTQAGADSLVAIRGSTDFLQIKPGDERFNNVAGILLDPSCSGSGIVGRDDEVGHRFSINHIQPAAAQASQSQTQQSSQPGRKRKRNRPVEQNTIPPNPLNASTQAGSTVDPGSASTSASISPQRLEALSTFQLKLLQHCMAFPAARRIVYSTCSIHVEENERVVVQALRSDAARRGAWKILPRHKQVPGLRAWSIRGLEAETQASLVDDIDIDIDAREVADACIRCEKGTGAGTMGFFVAAFYRDAAILPDAEDAGGTAHVGDQEADEWNGFSDSD